MTSLRTVRLVLRPCTPADRADFLALERDPDVMRYLNGGNIVGDDRSDPDAPYLMPRGTEPHVWTARLAATSDFVGWFTLWPDSDDEAELGYRLARAFWGQGLATEGAAALIRLGFDELGYARIQASTMAVNLASRRVLEKLGMTHIRTEYIDWPDPIPGAAEGEVIYELIRTPDDLADPDL